MVKQALEMLKKDNLIAGLKVLIAISVLNTLIIVGYFQFGVNYWLSDIHKVEAEKIEFQRDLKARLDAVENLDKKRVKNGGYYQIKEDDLKSVQTLVLSLQREAEKARERVVAETSNIIAKITLYVTIGITLLTLLGVFIPVVVQNLTHHELERKHEKLREEFNSSSDNVTAITQKVADLHSKTQDLDGIGEKVQNLNENVRQIPPVRLMFNLRQALDINYIRLYQKNPTKASEYFYRVFQSIRDDFASCKQENISSSDSILNSSIERFLQDCKTIRSFYEKRDVLQAFGELIKELESWGAANTAAAPYDNLLTRLDETLKHFSEPRGAT